MSAYKRGKSFTIRVPTRGGYVARTTGTGNRALVSAMERMFDVLGRRGRRDWPLLDAVKKKRITAAELYDAYAANDLEALRARLSDIDIAQYLAGREKWVARSLSETGGTAQRYRVHVSTLFGRGKPFLRSDLTSTRLKQWLGGLKVGNSTVRKYHAAMSSFCEYLKEAGLLERNPMRDIKAPRPAPERARYLDQPDVLRLVEAQPEPYRTLSALLHGTGLEISVALGLKRRDIDPVLREARARGTKTHCRDRQALIAEWAWPYVERHIALLTPNAPLFLNINRWTASDQHRDACKRLGIEDYRMHDARHTYAVRAIRAGAPFEVVARQLGHANTSMVVRVYGRFRPTHDESRAWERLAALQDEQRAKQNAPGGAST